MHRRYGRPEIRKFVLKHATLDAMLTTSKKMWLGCHNAAKYASLIELGRPGRRVHTDALAAWVSRMKELISDPVTRNSKPCAMGAYDVWCNHFKPPAQRVLQMASASDSIFQGVNLQHCVK